MHVLVLVGALLACPRAVTAQVGGSEEPERTLHGVVVDELTGAPIEGAVVRLDDHRPAAITDSLGHFTLRGFEPGPRTLEVRRFGYLEIVATIEPPGLPDVLVEIPLAPDPVMLDGLTAVVDRLALMERRIESRRRAVGVSSRVYDMEELAGSGAATVLDFLLRQASVHPVPCGRTGFCFLRRGRAIRPTIYIDELPAFGGLDELATYDPQDLYRVEIFSSGLQIRAYTYRFMERIARRPVALLPLIY